MRIAQLESGLVVDVLEVGDIAFYPGCVECPEWVQRGDSYANGAFAANPTTRRSIFEGAIQRLLDETAQSRGYDSILSAVTYVGSADPVFNAEGTALRAWRDSVWATARTIMQDVALGQRPMPTVEQVLSELPAINW